MTARSPGPPTDWDEHHLRVRQRRASHRDDRPRRASHHHRLRPGRRPVHDQIVREVGQRLITAPDLQALAGTLAAELPKVGIPGCYLASYEPVPADGAEPPTAPAAQVSTARSRLLLAYE